MCGGSAPLYSLQTPLCTQSGLLSDCGTYVGSVIFFVSFYIATNIVFVKVLIAALLGNVTQLHYTDDCAIRLQDIEGCVVFVFCCTVTLYRCVSV